MSHLDPKTEDARLQADPGLQTSTGRANPAQIVLTAIGAIAIVVLVLYGLNHQRDESPSAASAPASQTTGAAPPAGPQGDQNKQAGQNPPAAQGSQTNPQQGQAQTGSRD